MRRKPSPAPGSEEWIALRRSGIGATDAAVVAGRSRFHGPFDKYAEMMGRTAPLAETEPMRWGIILQGPVGREWAVRSNKRVRANGHTYWLEDGIYSHYDFDVVGEPAVLEVKTASAYAQREWGEQDTDQVPTEYLLQAQHEIMCRPGIERCYIAVLIGGQKLHKYVVERDDELIESMLTIDRKFLADTRAGIAPPVDGSRAATEYLLSLHPKDDGTAIELPSDTEDIALQYLAAKEDEKSVAARLTYLGNTLRERLEATAVATGRSVKVTYKATKDREIVDWERAARDAGADPAPYTTTKPGTRPLVVTWIGE